MVVVVVVVVVEVFKVLLLIKANVPVVVFMSL